MARQSAESRLAELSAALQRAEADALSHESDHLIEQQNRAAAEAKAGELAKLLDAARVDADNIHHELQARQKSNARLEEISEALTQANAEAEGRIAGLADRLTLAQTNHAAALADGDQALRTVQDARATLEEELRHTQELRLTAEHEASHLRSALIQRGQEADDLHNQTARDARQLADLEAALETARRDHAALSRQDERNTGHLEILTRRVTEYVRQDLENRLKPPADHESIEREHRALIADYEIRLISNRKTRAAAEADLVRVGAEKAALVAETYALRNKVTDRGHEIHALKKRLESRQSDIDALASQLAAAEAQAEAAAQVLKADLQQLKALVAEKAARVAETDALRNNVTDRGREIHALKNRLESGQSHIDALASQLAAAEARAEAAAQVLKADIQQLKALEAQLEAFTGSLSWRVTKPARAMSGMLRRIAPGRK